ncbi:hypothetical protein pgond44_10571 [Psychroflexus gondwanensis ACAM 44]|jgi:hypothetical protein|uniref:Uncharacterized protein n=1 Tax=Psychroflexus gondwanensis ACAM 44 TaxID=1189619 RepID=N1WYR7_9FLAO|nr:hypothetical protein [Psychroflexus gondwanensis]EMY80998.1 hypothetical protein pgond44_10571 [Psychroflexus gondwanensis ACAM 44]
MKNKTKLFVLAVFILVGGYFLINIFIGKLTYNVGGQRGYSKSLIESKERDVFVKKLNHKITPNSLKLNSNYAFFIERGFNYGNNSIFVTDSLIGNNQDSPYQLIYGCINPCKKFKSCNYDCDKEKYIHRDTLVLLESSSAFKLELENDFIRDTITYDILYNTLQSYKVDTIGKIKVWDSKILN